MSTDNTSFLDRPAARIVAVLVIILCSALLAYVHRDDLSAFGSSDQVDGGRGVADDPAAPCIQERFAEIDKMAEEGVVGDDQAALFKERAEAMCRATTGDGGQAPPLSVE